MLNWAVWPFFFTRMAISDQIEQLIELPIESLGYELVGIEYIKNGQHTVLRIYIDAEQGIGIEDCERVSHQVSGVLEVEDPISSAYSLEVSSPGFDRPLFKARDFERFVGSEVKIAMKLPIQGRRNFKGILQGFDDGEIVILVDGEEYGLPLTKLAKARLVA
jgi:ribosome maturation factor RimP